MVNSYTPTYYSSLHDSITSICKNILPFSLKKKRLPAIAAAEQKLSKHQSDNLKWQQESYHQILNLMGLCKEGILQQNEVSAFRSHLLDTLIASPLDHEHVVILKDKLVFLQELFYAQIITEEEYHSSKRPLLQRLAVQGAEIEARDLVVGETKAKSDEEWAAIDLKDDKCLISKENVNSKTKTKHGSTIKEAATSVFGFGSSTKTGKLREEKGVCGLSKQQEFGPFSSSGKIDVGVSQENPFWNCSVRDKENETKSILMASENLPQETSDKRSGGEKVKKNSKQWGFEGFKRWKRSDKENETAPLSLVEKSDGETYLGKLVEIPLGGGPDTVQMKKKLNSDGSSSEFVVDKVLGDKIRKELTRIQMEIKTKNPNAQFSNEQIEAISTRLPVDKADLKKFFPKSWCDRYGELVLDVVRKEFKEHVGEMKGQQQQQQSFAKDRNYTTISTNKWATFDDDDENCHPNIFALPHQPYSVAMKQANFAPANADRFAYSSSRHY